jgi:peptidyl-prolyl cis-trans isomerase C
MSKTLMKLSAMAFACALALPVQAQEDIGLDTVVATVNGTEITFGHMLMIRATLPEQYQQLPNDVLWDGIMEQLIQQQVLSQEDTAQETPRARLSLENERRALLAAEAIAARAETAVTEEAVLAAYQANYVDAEQGKEFNASHILVATEEEAAALVTELEGGADFAQLAREKSTGPSGPNGGELGWFGAGMMVAPFQEAVELLEVGGISGPVQTQFGWHVIKLNDARITEAPALDSVRAEIESQIQQDVVTAYIKDLVAKSEVTQTSKDDIDTSILSKIEMLEN